MSQSDVADATGSSRGRAGTRRALAALAFAAFVIGTAELVVVGILNLVAADVGVSVSSAGLLVTAYALGISIGGPVVTALTVRLGRRLVLLLSLAAFVAGNAVAAFAVGFGALVLARILTGSIHGLFIGVASVVAAGLVPAEHRGKAISMVFGGIAVSTVFGVPLGTLVGQTLGWQAAFVGIGALAAAALLLATIVVPPVQGRGSGGFGGQARAAFAPRVLAMLGVGFLLLGAQFTALTFLAPYLMEVTGVPGGLVSAYLFAFGIAAAVGTVMGGRFADRNATTTLIAANAVLIVALAAVYVAGASPFAMAVAVGAWGLAGFALVPSLQLRVITLAGSGGDLAATLGASAVNAGIAAGSAAGGWAIAIYGLRAAVLLAVGLAAIALLATSASRWLSPAVTSDANNTPIRGSDTATH